MPDEEDVGMFVLLCEDTERTACAWLQGQPMPSFGWSTTGCAAINWCLADPKLGDARQPDRLLAHVRHRSRARTTALGRAADQASQSSASRPSCASNSLVLVTDRGALRRGPRETARSPTSHATQIGKARAAPPIARATEKRGCSVPERSSPLPWR